MTQLITRRVREAGAYSEDARSTGGSRDGALAAEGARSCRRPRRWRLRLPARAAGDLREAAYRSSRSAIRRRPPPCSSAAPWRVGTRPVRPRRGRGSTRTDDSLRRHLGGWQALPVSMSHGDRVTRLPEGFTVKATSEHAPSPIASDDLATSTRPSTPEVVHTPTKPTTAQLRPQHSAPSRRLDVAPFRSGDDSRRSTRRSERRVICGLSGGVDRASPRRCSIARSATGSPASSSTTGLLRVGTRRRRSSRSSASDYELRLDPVDAEAAVPRCARRRHRPGRKRKIIGTALHRGLRGRGEEDPAGEVPRAGHALPGRDRERVVRRPLGDRSRSTTTSAGCPSG